MGRKKLIAAVCSVLLFAPGYALGQTTKPRPITETPEQAKERNAIAKKFAECSMKGQKAGYKNGTHQYNSFVTSCLRGR